MMFPTADLPTRLVCLRGLRKKGDMMSHSGFEARLNRFAVVGYYGMGDGVMPGRQSGATGIRPIQDGREDMDVRGVGSVSGAAPIRPMGGSPATRETGVSRPQAPRDELELSSAGKMLDQLSQNPDLRTERLNQIKAAIANGTYDTDEKLEAALSRMFDVLSQDLDNE